MTQLDKLSLRDRERYEKNTQVCQHFFYTHMNNNMLCDSVSCCCGDYDDDDDLRIFSVTSLHNVNIICTGNKHKREKQKNTYLSVLHAYILHFAFTGNVSTVLQSYFFFPFCLEYKHKECWNKCKAREKEEEKNMISSWVHDMAHFIFLRVFDVKPGKNKNGTSENLTKHASSVAAGI